MIEFLWSMGTVLTLGLIVLWLLAVWCLAAAVVWALARRLYLAITIYLERYL